MEFLSDAIISKLKPIAIRQIEVCSKFKQERLNQITQSEEFYYGKRRTTLEGVIVAQLPVMSGFVDTLLSKIDDPPKVNFGYTDLADYKRSLKVQSAHEIDSDPNHGDWNLKDRWEKKLAIFQAMGISKIYAESDPKYKSYNEVKDLFHFIFEPKGGGKIGNHSFCGEGNIWRTKHQLESGIESGLYMKKATTELIGSLGNKEQKRNSDLYNNAIERYSSLGVNMEEHSYVGQQLARLNEHYMEYNGKRYYLLLDYETGFMIRTHLLKDVFESEEWPYVVWHTHPDAFNFLSKAPADDARPLCTVLDRLISQVLTNREKINMGMRGFDTDMIPDPSQLKWRQDGLVEIIPKPGTNPKDAIYEFKIQNIGTGTIDLAKYIKAMLGIETGVTAGAQGVSEEERVGIHFSNLQQVADRLGLYNKAYKEAWAKKGMKYWQGLKEHLNEPMAVKMLGIHGIEWDELTSEDVRPIESFDIQAVGGASETEANELKKQSQTAALVDIRAIDPNSEQVNKTAFIKKRLELGGFEEADVKMIMSKDEFDIELLSEAEQAIQDILQGRKPKLNRGANTAFIRYILNFARDKINFEKKESDRKELQKQQWHDELVAYANAHIEIAQKNAQKAASMLPLAPQEQKPPVPGMPGTPKAPQDVEKGRQFSQLASNALQPSI